MSLLFWWLFGGEDSGPGTALGDVIVSRARLTVNHRAATPSVAEHGAALERPARSTHQPAHVATSSVPWRSVRKD